MQTFLLFLIALPIILTLLGLVIRGIAASRDLQQWLVFLVTLCVGFFVWLFVAVAADGKDGGLGLIVVFVTAVLATVAWDRWVRGPQGADKSPSPAQQFFNRIYVRAMRVSWWVFPAAGFALMLGAGFFRGVPNGLTVFDTLFLAVACGPIFGLIFRNSIWMVMLALLKRAGGPSLPAGPSVALR